MNRRICLMGVVVIFMLVTVSYATAVKTNTKNIENKESPLYTIRTRSAIGEKIVNIIENIKTRFLGERTFFIPFTLIRVIKPEKLLTSFEDTWNCCRTIYDKSCTEDAWEGCTEKRPCTLSPENC